MGMFEEWKLMFDIFIFATALIDFTGLPYNIYLQLFHFSKYLSKGIMIRSVPVMGNFERAQRQTTTLWDL